MKNLIVAFVAGTVFSIGLAMSGMTQPAKVVGFLDFTGAWDPSLVFVMGGAIAVYTPLYFFIKRRERPLLAPAFALPDNHGIDARLLGGAALFGVGWGLGGFCPGPAVTSLASGALNAIVFVGAMVAGMGIVRLVEAQRASAPSTPLTEAAGARDG